MKNKHVRKFSKTLVSAFLRGLAVFAIFGMALYAYAVTYPDNQPNPVSGVVGLYVGKTTLTYDGNDAGSYENANAYCASQHADSHVCTPMEIVNTYNHNLSAVENLTDIVWMNTAAPTNIKPSVSDCKGWSTLLDSSAFPYFANTWNFNIDSSGIQQCDSKRAFACCR